MLGTPDMQAMRKIVTEATQSAVITCCWRLGLALRLGIELGVRIETPYKCQVLQICMPYTSLP